MTEMHSRSSPTLNPKVLLNPKVRRHWHKQGKSLLANHTKDGHTCADDLQPNKRTCQIITLNSEDILHTWKDYL